MFVSVSLEVRKHDVELVVEEAPVRPGLVRGLFRRLPAGQLSSSVAERLIEVVLRPPLHRGLVLRQGPRRGCPRLEFDAGRVPGRRSQGAVSQVRAVVRGVRAEVVVTVVLCVYQASGADVGQHLAGGSVLTGFPVKALERGFHPDVEVPLQRSVDKPVSVDPTTLPVCQGELPVVGEDVTVCVATTPRLDTTVES